MSETLLRKEAAGQSENTPKRTVLIYGDSNTWGFIPGSNKMRYAPDVRWPGVFAKSLGASWIVVDAALCGRTTAFDDPLSPPFVDRNGLKLFGAVLESHMPLDLVIIFLGVNDLKKRFSLHAVDIASGVELLAGVALSPVFGPAGSGKPPAVMIICPPPIQEVPEAFGATFSGGAATSQGLRQAFERMSEKIGVPVIYADDFVCGDPADGIHFSAAHHGILGLEAAKRVKTLFPG